MLSHVRFLRISDVTVHRHVLDMTNGVIIVYTVRMDQMKIIVVIIMYKIIYSIYKILEFERM